MNKYLKFNCNCSFEITKEFDDERTPLVKFDIHNIPFNCSATWKLLSDGLNAGIFQLESKLGKHYVKELKPTCMEHLAALGSILRPGALDDRDEKGISVTKHYCLRKNGEEPVSYIHTELESILCNTYGLLCYQEQSIEICKKIAGFNLQEADSARKAIGKKLPQEMAKVKKKFFEGCEKTGKVDQATAEKIFAGIETSQRYQFNASHSFAYAIRGYKTAYVKAHFPLAFYTAKLVGSKQKIDTESSIQELINEAKLFNIEVKCPDLRHKRKYFWTDGKVIYFGLCDIKGIGESSVLKIKQALEGKSYTDFLDFCLKVALPEISDSVVLKLIEGGALDFFKLSRSQMLAEYRALMEFNNSERAILIEKVKDKSFPNITSLFTEMARLKKDGGVVHQKRRVEVLDSQKKLLENPISPYYDNPVWVAHTEETLLGYSVTCQKIDSCDTSMVNISCKDYISGQIKDFMLFGIDVREVIEKEIKRGDNKGKKFATLKLSDSSGSMEAIIWSEDWEKFQSLLTVGNSLIIQGERPYKKGKCSNSSLVVKKVWQAKA